MEFKTTFYAIIIAGMLITAVGILINDWGIEYGSGVTSDLGSYNKVGEASTYIQTYQGNINPQSGEASSDAETITYRGAYGIITGIFQPFRIIFSMIDSIFERFGLPDYIKIGIIAMMISAALFTIIAIVFRQLRPNV